MNHIDDLPDPRLSTLLETLRETEPRDSRIAEQQRTAFLAEAKELNQAVSPQPFFRLNKWRAIFNPFLVAPQKEKNLMFKTAIAFVMIVSLFAGGGTMVAAQSSLPDEALYPIKTWTEDTQISLTGNSQDQLQLNLEFATRRIQEIQTMFQTGNVPPETVVSRLEIQLQNALALAVNMPDDEVTPDLLQIQTQLQQHEQTMAQFQFSATEPVHQVQVRVQNLIQNNLRLAQGGVTNPQWLREQLQAKEQEQNRNQNGPGAEGTPWTTGTPASGAGYGPGAPGDSQNPWTTGTPTPGSGYGPGGEGNPWTTGTPTPGSGYGPGAPGDSQNPWTTGTPTPGSGYGPGEPQNPGSNNPPSSGNGNDSGGGNGNQP